MKIYIPTPLRSYTNKSLVEATGTTVIEIIDDLNKQFPGLKFRLIDEQDQIRPHMRIFINNEQTMDLNKSVSEKDEVHLLQALSGG